MQYDALMEAVLRLPADQRGELAARLLDSLAEEGDERLDPDGWKSAWTEELRKRLAAPTSNTMGAENLIDELEAELLATT